MFPQRIRSFSQEHFFRVLSLQTLATFLISIAMELQILYQKFANFQVDNIKATQIIIIFSICLGKSKHGKSTLGKSKHGKSALGKSTLGKSPSWEKLPWETHPWHRCHWEQSLGKRPLEKNPYRTVLLNIYIYIYRCDEEQFSTPQGIRGWGAVGIGPGFWADLSAKGLNIKSCHNIYMHLTYHFFGLISRKQCVINPFALLLVTSLEPFSND